MQGLAVANRRVIDELPTVAVGSGILDASADDDDRARARTWARKSARRVTRGLRRSDILTQRPVGGREGDIKRAQQKNTCTVFGVRDAVKPVGAV